MPPVSEALTLARPDRVSGVQPPQRSGPNPDLSPQGGGELQASLAAKPERLILGVAGSALGRPWRPRLDAAGDARALAIAQGHGHPDILARVLAGRGVTHETAVAHLDPTVRALMPEPFTLQGMEAAVARLVRAIEARETVAIFGDYDVDGACSAALLAGFLDAAGCPRLIHIPDRIFEGYGPNIAAIEILKRQGATLLVCVDCGTTSHGPLAQARALGLDAIVIDHHQAPEVLPEAIVVNPNRLDDLSGLGQLCAAGVVMMVMVALNRALRERGFWTGDRPAPDLLTALDLVALATVADVAPLIGLNRAFVIKGLGAMRARLRPGLTALIDCARLNEPPRPYHLGFLLGPRINAGGRIGDASLGAKLLLCGDPDEAARIAAELDRLNGERRLVEKAALESAQKMVLEAQAIESERSVIIAGAEDWHPGVIGLVAARLRERFDRPAFAIAFAGEMGTGSGRSIPGVDLGGAVRNATEAGLLEKGGGHAMAAGITLRRDQLAAFRDFLEVQIGPSVAAARADASLKVDAVLTAAGATPEIVHLIEKAGPFNSGNSEPIIVVPGHRVEQVSEIGDGHLRMCLTGDDGGKLEAFAFGALGRPLGDAILAARGERAHVAGHLTLDRWGGGERVRLRVLDIAHAGLRRS
ncbi:MAG: single-stranded-DNA-specific exonuclease RecJ [Methylobacteriaceae bacterium]|nr:single-stranded-DNA-specific exonuclease RecJ [Methylobacteriaceae bacterium]